MSAFQEWWNEPVRGERRCDFALREIKFDPRSLMEYAFEAGRAHSLKKGEQHEAR